jgi:CHAT domain-containing protein
LAVHRAVGNRSGEATALSNAAAAYSSLGDRARAATHYQQALTLARAIGDRKIEAGVLEGVARLERAGGDLERAHASARAAMAIVESLRANVSSPDLRASSLASNRELYELCIELLMVQAEIRAKSPRHAALTQAQPLSLERIQRHLDADTVLLEYALGDATSYLWAVTRDAVTPFELRPRAEVERAARRAYEMLQVSHRRTGRRQAELALAELGAMVLGPAAAHLPGKRLLIVADGVLQYVPFGALLRPAADHSLVPLIVDHEIVSLPSASVMAVQRRELAGRPRADKSVAVLADPVLEPDDPRIRRSADRRRDPGERAMTQHTPGDPNANRSMADLNRSASDLGIVRFDRLPFTRDEADAIIALADDAEALKRLDFDASRAAVHGGELDRYRIIHFATHGILNSQHPELSGIVLSLFEEDGTPRNGFVRAHEIVDLKLTAELVVLSACRTALGKEVDGEGFLGLVRGFMHAGAARVVASMWDVRDEATAVLMKRFYEGMLRDGLTPAAALRSAQVSLWKETRFEAPYYWAGFVIQGEWN